MTNNVYSNHLFAGRNRIIILGLTGRTGSGCSTVASILSKPNIKDIDLRPPKNYDYDNAEQRKRDIIIKYMSSEQHWNKFDVIDMSSIILSCVFEKSARQILKFIRLITSKDKDKLNIIGDKKELLNSINQIKDMSKEIKEYPLENINPSDFLDETIDRYYQYYLAILPVLKSKFRNILQNQVCYKFDSRNKPNRRYNLYTYLMQRIGNNLRRTNDPFEEQSNFDNDKYNEYLGRINKLIKIINLYNEKHSIKTTRICIDAIRNPYEARYFRDKYRSFYLMAIKCDDTDRVKRFKSISQYELDNIDGIECQEVELIDSFYHQDIQACIEIADIHIYNPEIDDLRYYGLTDQIIKYLALILHPGLVTPTSIERCMQLAYTAKLNSGCLSRQVGAVVTRADYSVQAVGWNDIPEGQVSCYLRDTEIYCNTKDVNMFSKFELTNETFDNAIKCINKATINNLCGLTMSYCFKDVYNTIKGKSNQVYTRALHAEENAFLQITKYGGGSVRGGCLFTTASPCELCAKKAYQLGIRKIYYIDPYPGISKDHILTFGTDGNPEMIFFQGAIGSAYIDFYSPRMQRKDELEVTTGVNVKKLIKNNLS